MKIGAHLKRRKTLSKEIYKFGALKRFIGSFQQIDQKNAIDFDLPEYYPFYDKQKLRILNQ